MDNTTEAVDTVFRVTYNSIAYAFRIIEEAARAGERNNARLAGVMAGMNQQDYSTRSAMEMERMIQQGKRHFGRRQRQRSPDLLPVPERRAPRLL